MLVPLAVTHLVGGFFPTDPFVFPPLRMRPGRRADLLHLRRGPVGADAGGPGHAGEAGGDAGAVGSPALPHGRSPHGRQQS